MPGVEGRVGSKGDPGVNGADGAKGNTGSPGMQGVMGVSGDRGKPGTDVSLGTLIHWYSYNGCAGFCTFQNRPRQ